MLQTLVMKLSIPRSIWTGVLSLMSIIFDCDNWTVSLVLFSCFQLTKQLNLGDTMAAKLAPVMIGTSDKAVRDWSLKMIVRSAREQVRQVPASE